MSLAHRTMCGACIPRELIQPELMRSRQMLRDSSGALLSPKLKPEKLPNQQDRLTTIERKLNAISPAAAAMQSLRKLYRTGPGPSSSHTMGPRRAAGTPRPSSQPPNPTHISRHISAVASRQQQRQRQRRTHPASWRRFRKRFPECRKFRVSLYGSLAATGRGHLTDVAVRSALEPADVEFVWDAARVLPRHPNAMQFEALSDDGATVLATWVAYSVGGGAVIDDDTPAEPPAAKKIYSFRNMRQIIAWANSTGKPVWQYPFECEGEGLRAHLEQVWETMKQAIHRGVNAVGVLPGGLNLRRRAHTLYLKTRRLQPIYRRNMLLFSYALAVSEENAACGVVVTAPTCGAAGVLPAVLKWSQDTLESTEEEIVWALSTAGIFGNICKSNASISGAEVGCQGEVGVACSMAAAACAQLMGGTPDQIEHAAEMALEHHLGMSCCPIEGLVQIPCIDRNAFAANWAVDCAEFALALDGKHRISFDEVVLAMKMTGLDMGTAYKETSQGGISITYNLDEQEDTNHVKALEDEISHLRRLLSTATQPEELDLACPPPAEVAGHSSLS
eukprot:m51a1_g8567 hypothetical protein (561) ;mRNA; f:185772-188106